MAKLVSTISVDFSGLRPMQEMCESLGEALATAQFDEPLEIATEKDGVRFGAQLIAKLHVSPPRDGVIYARAVPTIYLPQFAVAICRRAPGVKVTWRHGWPHFSATDGDDPEDLPVDPVEPLELVL